MKLVCALAALILASCTNPPATRGVPADFCLTLARSACFGRCPVYHMTIDALGNVAFTGDRYTSVVGEHDRKMTADEVKKLVAAIDAINFFSLSDHEFGPWQCPTRSTDSPSVCITLRMNGRTHTIRHYHGCDGFRGQDELIAFEDRIDALAGVGPWKKDDERLDRRRMLVWRFAGICKTGAACEEAATLFEHEYLLLTDNVQIRRDGTAVLQTQSIPFVREVHATLPPDRLRELTTRVASIPRPDGIPFVEQPSDDLQPFANDQTFTRDAKSIRIEAMPVSLRGSIYQWPAEDLIPAAQLTKRPLTRDEWNALRLRLLSEKRDGVLDGKPFGMNTPVMLRVIATP